MIRRHSEAPGHLQDVMLPGKLLARQDWLYLLMVAGPAPGDPQPAQPGRSLWGNRSPAVAVTFFSSLGSWSSQPAPLKEWRKRRKSCEA